MKEAKIDIELIRKYHSGQLDGKAMQELEERALEDSFLSDAMDGYGEYSVKTADLNYLDEKLKDRLVYSKNKRVLAFKNWYLAASIIILIGFVSIYLNLPDDNLIVSKKESFTAESNVLKEESANDLIIDDTGYSKENLIEESPVIVSIENAQKKSKEILASSDQVIIEPALTSTYLADSTGKENLTTTYSRKSAENFAASSVLASRSLLNNSISADIINGKVLDADDKQPLVGVSILDISTGKATSTDANGDFQIVADLNSKLSFQNIGYLQKEVEIGKKENDSLKFYLKRDNAALSEVAVVGYDSSNKKKSVGPKNGWPAFKKYLNENSELETNEAGTVVVEFVINSSGDISDLRILKSLSKLADARAIYLIRNYPSWQGALDGSANKVKVTIRFK